MLCSCILLTALSVSYYIERDDTTIKKEKYRYMATTTIVGVFEDEAGAEGALRDLQGAGFRKGQLGVLARGVHDAEGTVSGVTSEEEREVHRGPGTLARGLLGGIMGAIDVLLLPVTGPADANLI